MRKPLYICLPYRDVEFTMVYAGNDRPQTDGAVIKVTFADDDSPDVACLVQWNGEQL